MLRRTLGLRVFKCPYRLDRKTTQHTDKWHRRAGAFHITKRLRYTQHRNPAIAPFHEEVDRPFLLPAKVPCFNCTETIDTEADPYGFLWIPSGAAKKPYIFHRNCFKCWECKFRFYHNRFYTKDKKAICVGCAVGKPVQFPTRRWHTSYTQCGRTASRMTGTFFPRKSGQLGFVYSSTI